ncbi:MAG: monovalent cation/H+ antiporter subunit D [Thauera sp.]|jgi:multicomponent K+:H+ antiporter subunit D|nr:monovalent cation/H+ antiporter subunit D [Thauera sp.]
MNHLSLSDFSLSALPLSDHLIVLPVLLPLLVGALLIPIRQTRHGLKLSLSIGSVMLQWLLALNLLWMVDRGHWPADIGVYLAANWQAPFGIALLLDRLSALMLLLTTTIALAVLVFAARRWDRVGVHFHAMFQFLMMGLNGAFLTNDLFNLFVFFEIMLAASYGLVLHGYNLQRIRAGMQYIAINLAASLLFLIGVALIYAASGTLNLSDLGMRVSALGDSEHYLLILGVCILALAFLTKGGMWPLGFWLPGTYASASAPVAAMLVLMTKVGIYAVLRLWFAVFGEHAGSLSGFGFDALTIGGMATLLFGAIGMLASQEGGRMAGYGAIISSGTLLAVIGQSAEPVLASGLYYLVGSTLAMAAFMLLVELTDRIRPPGAALIAITMEAFAIEDKPEDPVGQGIPASLAFLGLSFAACALVISGMPPLSGFVAKFSLFHTLLKLPANAEQVSMLTWALIALVIIGGLAAIIALMRLGVRIFWAAGDVAPPRLRFNEVAPVSALVGLCVLITVQAAGVFDYLERTAQGLHQLPTQAERVLGTPVVSRADGALLHGEGR